MSANLKTDSLSAVLFGKTRRALFSLLFSHPDESFYLRQIARLTGAGMGGLQRELKTLTDAGILKTRMMGRQAYFQANSDCPVFDELKRLVIKTFGAADLIRSALSPLAGSIRTAFIFGSIARAEPNRRSDLDLMVIGNVSFEDVVSSVSPVQDALAREINPVAYSEEEFRSKAARGTNFIKRVIESPKLFVVGDASDFKKLVG
jgi:predicted nucleotidyltransferase